MMHSQISGLTDQSRDEPEAQKPSYPPTPACNRCEKVRNQYGPYAYCSLGKGVAVTRGRGGKSCITAATNPRQDQFLVRGETRRTLFRNACIRGARPQEGKGAGGSDGP
jgi:hypothetical protein